MGDAGRGHDDHAGTPEVADDAAQTFWSIHEVWAAAGAGTLVAVGLTAGIPELDAVETFEGQLRGPNMITATPTRQRTLPR